MEDTFHKLLPEIDRILTVLCRKYGLQGPDADDFRQEAKLHLIQDDYRALRKRRGDSSWRTYLVIVLRNFGRDFHDRKWGKWRPCAAARRGGLAGEMLDRLLHRDGRSWEDTLGIMRQEFPDLSGEEIEELAATLTERNPRPRVETGEALEDAARTRPADTLPVGRGLEDEEKADSEHKVQAVLDETLSQLSAEDRLILRSFFQEGRTIAATARRLGLEQKPLYRRIPKLARRLRRAFERAGISWDDVKRLEGWNRSRLRADFGDPKTTEEDDPQDPDGADDEDLEGNGGRA